MRSKFALQTLFLTTAWLFLQNFNILANPGLAVCYPETSTPSYISPPFRGFYGGKNPRLPVFGREGNYKIKKVVLDAGHGGKDPGCIGAVSHEKDNALAIVLNLGHFIEENFQDIEVIYTRTEDVFIELHERADIANRNKADLFISVHCNALATSSAKGAETYVLGLHKAQHNLEVAKRENASIYLEKDYQKNYEGYDPDSPEAHIMGSMWQSAYLEQSILLAGFVQQQAKSIATREDRGVKQAGFLVLRETAMPAVLVEAGYLTNVDEEAFIASEEGQMAVAEAIFEAFVQYKNRMEGNKSVPAQPKTKPVAVAAKGKPTVAAAPKVSPVPPKDAPTPKVVSVAQKDTPVPAAVQSGEAAFNKPKNTAQSGPSAQPSKPLPEKKLVSASGTSPSSPANTKTNAGPKSPNVDPNSAYRIFLLAHTVPMNRNSGLFALLNEVKEEKKEGKYHYFTGTFATRSEADKMLPEIRNLGFSTAKVEEVK